MKLAGLALMTIVSACSPGQETKAEKPKHYVLRGVVVRLDPDHNLASIKGEKIEGWMDAMIEGANSISSGALRVMRRVRSSGRSSPLIAILRSR